MDEFDDSEIQNDLGHHERRLDEHDDELAEALGGLAELEARVATLEQQQRRLTLINRKKRYA